MSESGEDVYPPVVPAPGSDARAPGVTGHLRDAGVRVVRGAGHRGGAGLVHAGAGLHRRARRHGGGQVEGPADTPWNTRDLHTRDPDGNLDVFTAPRPPEDTDPAFTARIRDLADQQLG